MSFSLGLSLIVLNTSWTVFADVFHNFWLNAGQCVCEQWTLRFILLVIGNRHTYVFTRIFLRELSSGSHCIWASLYSSATLLSCAYGGAVWLRVFIICFTVSCRPFLWSCISERVSPHSCHSVPQRFFTIMITHTWPLAIR